MGTSCKLRRESKGKEEGRKKKKVVEHRTKVWVLGVV
jgi:hypothetical protein